MAEIKGHHAHVYYNADTRKIAEVLRETIIRRFSVEPGAFSDEPRGPGLGQVNPSDFGHLFGFGQA